MRKALKLAPVLLLLLATAACIHKTGGAVTPWERVHTYNAALADANNAVEQGMEIAVSSNLIPPAQAAPVINMTGQVAMLHQQITSILAQGQATQPNIASVKALVDQVKASVASLPTTALGFKNPKSQQTFQQDVTNIGTLADSVLSALIAAGGGQ